MKNYIAILCFISLSNTLFGQLSPGELSTPHSKLEGLSNCTKCHVLGNKVSSDKCLDCHKELLTRINQNSGYHSSATVKEKQCFNCHSEHHGRSFRLVSLNIKSFNHTLTGYTLSVPHSKKECTDCHSIKHIKDELLKGKAGTYLGLNRECLSCHEDYHRSSLSGECLKCHNPDYFKPAPSFSHTNARFQLKGKHGNVACEKCHRITVNNGKKFQEFKSLKFGACTDCHKDPHQNKFGQDCARCHNEESFLSVKAIKGFDHSRTKFPLEGKHLSISCTVCHKTKYTDPIRHDKCNDCHSDYHKKQFAVNGVSPDCSLCHNVKGFSSFVYTFEQHNQGAFPLKGSHLAVPCIECHKSEKEWSFRNIGKRCKDCHKDIHLNFIPLKYYPNGECKNCHDESAWSAVNFDHSKTSFLLTGAHEKQSCRLCHFREDKANNPVQKFSGLPVRCFDCHSDIHNRQFEKKGITECSTCHSSKEWKPTLFNHDNAAFKLDGKHVNVPCIKCHKPVKEGSVYYTKYKLNLFTCESCHS